MKRPMSAQARRMIQRPSSSIRPVSFGDRDEQPGQGWSRYGLCQRISAFGTRAFASQVVLALIVQFELFPAR